jgi:hypothetical protein
VQTETSLGVFGVGAADVVSSLTSFLGTRIGVTRMIRGHIMSRYFLLHLLRRDCDSIKVDDAFLSFPLAFLNAMGNIFPFRASEIFAQVPLLKLSFVTALAVEVCQI